MTNRTDIKILKGRLPRTLYLISDVEQYSIAYLVSQIENINQEEIEMRETVQKELAQITQVVDFTVIGKMENDRANIGLNFKDTKVEPIKLHINCRGGEVTSGLMLVNAILTSEVPIEAHIHFSASMGSVIASVCDYRIGYPTTRAMFHDISYGEYGKYKEHKKRMEEVENLKQTVKDLVLEYTVIPEKLYDEKMEGDDWYLTKDEMFELGFIDEFKVFKKYENVRKEAEDMLEKAEPLGADKETIEKIVKLLEDDLKNKEGVPTDE